jgi:hypothetical protein
MQEAFVAGGPGMIPTLVFGLILTCAALLYAVRPEKRFVPVQISLGILTLASGSLGFVAGLIKSFSPIPHPPPGDSFLFIAGMGESLNNVALAVGCIALAALAATVGTLRLAMRRAA